MGTFHSIDELIKTLDREKVLLKEMFAILRKELAAGRSFMTLRPTERL